MRRNKRWLAVLLCLLLAVGMAACQKNSETAGGSTDTAAESVQNTDSESAVRDSKKETKEKKESQKTTEKKASEEKKGSTAASSKTSTKSAKSDSKKSAKKQTESKKPSGHVLTIKKGSKKVYFTEKELSAMGKVSYKYSYRNKDSEHRQFLTCSGVKFSTVISKSGLSGSTVRVRASDGYTKEFSVSQLNSTKKAFLKTTGSSAKSVPAILTLGDSDSFRLVFGQSAGDTDEEGDYNATHWVKWIDTIELY